MKNSTLGLLALSLGIVGLASMTFAAYVLTHFIFKLW